MSTTAAPTIAIAPASDAEIETVAHVYQAAAEDLSDRLRAKNPWTNLAARSEDFEQAVKALRVLRNRDHQAVVIARSGDEVVGMGAVSIQMPHAHIAFLFVKPSAQNQGVGRSLLAALRERIDVAGATVVSLASSRDPKAWKRYMQYGLVPAPPQLPFRSQVPTFPDVAPTHERLVMRPATVADIPAIAELDLPVRGAERRDRIEAWFTDENRAILVCDRITGQPAGYAMTSLTPHWAQLGPVVVREHDDFPFVLQSALHLAGTTPNPKGLHWRIDCSAHNRQVIAPLMQAGFAAENLVIWFESEPIGQWDRYIFRNEDEL